MRTSVVALGLCLATLSGCGVGIGQMVTRGTIGPDDDNTFDNTGSSYVSDTSVGLTRANAITIYDSTGIMLAALGTAGNAYNAQQEAERNAVARGAQAGDTYEYSYDVVQPAAGTNTRLTLAWGSTGDASISGPLGDGDRTNGDEVDYFLMDVRAVLGGYDLEGNGRWNFSLGVLYESWSGTFNVNTENGAVGHELDSFWIGMPLGTTVMYPLIGPLSATGGVAIDPLMSLFSGLLGGGGHWLFLEASARLDFRPVEWLLIWGGATERIVPWDLGSRTGEATVFDVGIAFMYAM